MRQSYGRGQGRGRNRSSKAISFVTLSGEDGQVMIRSSASAPAKSNSLVLIKSNGFHSTCSAINNNESDKDVNEKVCRDKATTNSCLYYASGNGVGVGVGKGCNSSRQVEMNRRRGRGRGRYVKNKSLYDGVSHGVGSKKWARVVKDGSGASGNAELTSDGSLNVVEGQNETWKIEPQVTDSKMISLQENIANIKAYAEKVDQNPALKSVNEESYVTTNTISVREIKNGNRNDGKHFGTSNNSNSDDDDIQSFSLLEPGKCFTLPVLKGPRNGPCQENVFMKKHQNKKYNLQRDTNINKKDVNSCEKNKDVDERELNILNVSNNVEEPSKREVDRISVPILKGPTFFVRKAVIKSKRRKHDDTSAIDEKAASAKRVALNEDIVTGKTALTDFAYRQTSKQTTAFQKRGKSKSRGYHGLVRVDPKDSDPICQKFLRGECYDERCFKRHDIPREAGIPICSFFQRGGMCTKENCCFRHIKVASRAEICPSFQEKGYCNNQGCTLKHFRQKASR